jgi:hypothetical protein
MRDYAEMCIISILNQNVIPCFFFFIIHSYFIWFPCCIKKSWNLNILHLKNERIKNKIPLWLARPKSTFGMVSRFLCMCEAIFIAFYSRRNISVSRRYFITFDFVVHRPGVVGKQNTRDTYGPSKNRCVRVSALGPHLNGNQFSRWFRRISTKFLLLLNNNK